MTIRQAKIKALIIAANCLNLPHNEDSKTEFHCKELAKEMNRRRVSLEATETREAIKKALKTSK